MSAKGQKLTRGLVSRDVRFVPKADIVTTNGEKGWAAAQAAAQLHLPARKSRANAPIRQAPIVANDCLWVTAGIPKLRRTAYRQR
jgi:hypothetical protein